MKGSTDRKKRTFMRCNIRIIMFFSVHVQGKHRCHCSLPLQTQIISFSSGQCTAETRFDGQVPNFLYTILYPYNG